MLKKDFISSVQSELLKSPTRVNNIETIKIISHVSVNFLETKNQFSVVMTTVAERKFPNYVYIYTFYLLVGRQF